MLTSTSIRSPTVSAFCSKLQLFFPLCPLSRIMLMSSKHLRPFRLFVFFSAPARKSCQLPAHWRRRYEDSKPGLCLRLYFAHAGKHLNVSLFLFSKSSRTWSEWRNGSRWWRTGTSTGTVKRYVKHSTHLPSQFWPHFHLFLFPLCVLLFPFSLLIGVFLSPFICYLLPADCMIKLHGLFSKATFAKSPAFLRAFV